MSSTKVTNYTAVSVPTRRKLAPDLARGFMLLLIAMAYAKFYVGSEFGVPVPDHSALDRGTAVGTTLLLDRRAFPMFAILFGYGLAWMVARRIAQGRDPDEVRRQVRRRGYALLLFGAVHAFFVYTGEILMPYGVAVLVTAWLLTRSNRAFVVAAAVLAGAYVVIVTAVMVLMSFARAQGGSEDIVAGYTTVADWVGRAAQLPVMPVLVATSAPLLLLVVLGYYAARLSLLDDPETHRPTLVRIAVAGTAVSLAGAVPAALVTAGVLTPDPLPTGLLLSLSVLTGVFGGAGYAAVFALLSIRLSRSRGPVTRAVSAVGQRSLTFYLANSVLLAILLNPDLLGLPVGVFGALVTAACVWCAGVAVASWLDRTNRPGPLDALMRRLVNR